LAFAVKFAQELKRALSSIGFSLGGSSLACTETHRLKPVPLGPKLLNALSARVSLLIAKPFQSARCTWGNSDGVSRTAI
jgi:hypothetical protein